MAARTGRIFRFVPVDVGWCLGIVVGGQSMRTLLLLVIAAILVLTEGESALRTAQRWTGIYDYEQLKDAVTSKERAEELSSKGLREQIISFEEMRNIKASYGQAATEYDLFAIGVGQITLNEPESRAERVVVLGARRKFDFDGDTSYRPADLPPAPAYGNFNNILLFDRKANQITKIFDSRISIFQFRYGWRTKPELLVIFAADADTNADGVMDGSDKGAIYLYTLADRTLHKIELPPSVDPEGFVDIPDADYLILRGSVDRHASAKRLASDDAEPEPMPQTFLRIDLKTFKATPFVPPEMVMELQKTLDAAPVEDAPAPVEQPMPDEPKPAPAKP